MSDISPKLALPYIQPSQAQKHVTHNEAIQRLDVLVQAVVKDSALATAPAAPDEGDSYIVPVGGTGLWAGYDGDIATFLETGWVFITPQNGWAVHDLSLNTRLTYGDAGWSETTGNVQVTQLGVSAAPDATNRLSISSPASLLNHAGGGHQLKLNKAAPTDTASLLFQSGFSGRAEMGLAGSDGWSLKVSTDGSAWKQALHVDPAAETVSIAPAGTPRLRIGDSDVEIDAPITGTAVQSSAVDTTPGRLMKTGAFGLGIGAPFLTDLTGAIPPGLWSYPENTAVGSPGTSAFANLLFTASAQGGGQGFIAIRQTSNVANQKFWFGSRTGATGAISWVEIRHQGNILGTVSQSGGVPTGALIERGANANGSYTRFADGTQWCSHQINLGSLVTSGSGTLAAPYESGTADWTFPAAFSTAPGYALQPGSIGIASGQRAFVASPFGVSATSMGGIKATATTSLSTVRDAVIEAIAIGRWY